MVNMSDLSKAAKEELAFTAEEQKPEAVVYDITPPTLPMAAEPVADYENPVHPAE